MILSIKLFSLNVNYRTATWNWKPVYLVGEVITLCCRDLYFLIVFFLNSYWWRFPLFFFSSNCHFILELLCLLLFFMSVSLTQWLPLGDYGSFFRYCLSPLCIFPQTRITFSSLSGKQTILFFSLKKKCFI